MTLFKVSFYGPNKILAQENVLLIFSEIVLLAFVNHALVVKHASLPKIGAQVVKMELTWILLLKNAMLVNLVIMETHQHGLVNLVTLLAKDATDLHLLIARNVSLIFILQILSNNVLLLVHPDLLATM